ncbi:MAG TPA: hypothetical protein VFW13_00100 [Phenylobacterium sp.]|nr:hypothetical protein [Phenylobacterium sp.]
MKPSLTTLIVVAALAAAANPVRAATCHADFAFRPNPSLDLATVTRLVAQGSQTKSGLEAKDGGRLVVWPFDEEDHPTFGQWRAIALVFVTRGDLGEDTVGGLLLQAGSEPPVSIDKARLTKGPNGLRLSMPAPPKCPRFIIELDNNGGLVAGGQVVGRLR